MRIICKYDNYYQIRQILSENFSTIEILQTSPIGGTFAFLSTHKPKQKMQKSHQQKHQDNSHKTRLTTDET
jgi:hypothetical protein